MHKYSSLKEDCSGKFVLRMNPSHHKRLRDLAMQANLSLNSFVLGCIEKAIQNHKDSYENVFAVLKKFLKDDCTGVLLFGSTARGEARESSDIDLMVVISPDVEINSTLYKRWNRFLEKENPKDFTEKYSFHFSHFPAKNKMPSGVWLECALDAVVLKDSLSSEIASRLKEIRMDIVNGKYQRKSAHGQNYWVEG